MDRDYTYLSYTRSICSHCGRLCDGKIVYNDSGVFLLKCCPEHGEHLELYEDLSSWQLRKVQYDKPGTGSLVQSEVRQGCPYDCGLCPSHDQHSCIGLIEITGRCNLGCSMCYASAGEGIDLDLPTIERMMDFLMAAEDHQAEILQISGGEPTLHPDILTVLHMAKQKGFRYVMLNTNGIRLAEEEAFAASLAELRGGFEVYLQFDGLQDGIYRKLRGRDLAQIKERAIRNLTAAKVPSTLVATIETGVNDDVIGEILTYGMNTPGVRGVNFQPLAYYGSSKAPASRATLSGILAAIEKQTGGLLRLDDFIPLPCNTERVALTYLLRDKSGFKAITRNRDLREFRQVIGSTFMFTVDDVLANFQAGSSIFNLKGCCDLIEDIKGLLPLNYLQRSKEEKLRFVDENTFRISVSSFIDRYNFEMKSAQKECVHVVTPDLRRIPFSMYNLIHRGS